MGTRTGLRVNDLEQMRTLEVGEMPKSISMESQMDGGVHLLVLDAAVIVNGSAWGQPYLRDRGEIL